MFLTCRVTRPANNCLLWARVLPSGFSCLELGTFPTYSEARARFTELRSRGEDYTIRLVDFKHKHLKLRTARLGGFTLSMNVCTLSANRREVMARVCTHTGTQHDRWRAYTRNMLYERACKPVHLTDISWTPVRRFPSLKPQIRL